MFYLLNFELVGWTFETGMMIQSFVDVLAHETLRKSPLIKNA